MGALSCDNPGPPATHVEISHLSQHMQKTRAETPGSFSTAPGSGQQVGLDTSQPSTQGQGPHGRWDGVGHQATLNTGAKVTQEMGLNTRLCPVQPRERLKVPP